jgi:hypothetical protein
VFIPGDIGVVFKFIIASFDNVVTPREFIESPFGADPKIIVFSFDNVPDYIARQAVLVVDVGFVNVYVATVIHVQAVEGAYPKESFAVLEKAYYGTV